jgi:hypothetical protein
VAGRGPGHIPQNIYRTDVNGGAAFAAPAQAQPRASGSRLAMYRHMHKHRRAARLGCNGRGSMVDTKFDSSNHGL